MPRFHCSVRARFIAFLLVSVMVACPEAHADLYKHRDAPSKRTLVLGKVSDNPRKHYGNLKPMVDYVVKRMGDLGITMGKVLLARDNRQMIEYLRRGEVDWVTETPFSAVAFRDAAGAQILLRKWKKGVAKYHSVIFARKDSSINTLDDLKGRTIAFEDPGSTSAYFIPAAVLIGKGLTLARVQSVRDRPPADTVGYAFSGEEVNTSVWVYKGLADAGAFSNLDWGRDDQLPVNLRKELKIIHRTADFPRALELVNKALAPVLKKRLEEILLHAHEDPKAEAVLQTYQLTSKFDRLDGEGLASLKEAQRLHEIVLRELP